MTAIRALTAVLATVVTAAATGVAVFLAYWMYFGRESAEPEA